MIIFVDFDNTICNHKEDGPSTDCISFLKLLKDYNHTIVVYSCRSNPDCVNDTVKAEADMIKFLEQYKVPYDRIERNKPFYNYIIDDRAIGCPKDENYNVDWVKLAEWFKNNK